jgi:mRNA-degrading endonuclease YafQ of YafQ-DinJ toxin-antitoxin module
MYTPIVYKREFIQRQQNPESGRGSVSTQINKVELDQKYSDHPLQG